MLYIYTAKYIVYRIMAICDIDIMQWCHIEEDALDVKSSWGDSLGIVLV